MKKIAISEVFYSIQGEGKTVGIPSVFIRLGGCNLMCGGMGTQFDGEKKFIMFYLLIVLRQLKMMLMLF